MRFAVVSCEDLRFSARICVSQMRRFLGKGENQRKSAKISVWARFVPLGLSPSARPKELQLRKRICSCPSTIPSSPQAPARPLCPCCGDCRRNCRGNSGCWGECWGNCCGDCQEGCRLSAPQSSQSPQQFPQHFPQHPEFARQFPRQSPQHFWGIRAWGPCGMERGLGEGLAEKVGKGLVKGWQRVGEGLAQGWRRVSGFPCTLQFRNSRGARLETLVCDSMVVSYYAVVFLLRPPAYLLLREPLFEGKTACKTQEFCVSAGGGSL